MDTWFYPHIIANILSLAITDKHYPVAFNTTDTSFTFHLEERKIIFIQSEGDLYCFDIVAEEEFSSACYSTEKKLHYHRYDSVVVIPVLSKSIQH